eukprot:gene24512-biopygen10070
MNSRHEEGVRDQNRAAIAVANTLLVHEFIRNWTVMVELMYHTSNTAGYLLGRRCCGPLGHESEDLHSPSERRIWVGRRMLARCCKNMGSSGRGTVKIGADTLAAGKLWLSLPGRGPRKTNRRKAKAAMTIKDPHTPTHATIQSFVSPAVR